MHVILLHKESQLATSFELRAASAASVIKAVRPVRSLKIHFIPEQQKEEKIIFKDYIDCVC